MYLTDLLLRSLKPQSKDYTIWDLVAPSLGVRVLPSGLVRFILGVRFPGCPSFTRRALGGYDELPLVEARRRPASG